jgi:hypothetical protein
MRYVRGEWADDLTNAVRDVRDARDGGCFSIDRSGW